MILEDLVNSSLNEDLSPLKHYTIQVLEGPFTRSGYIDTCEFYWVLVNGTKYLIAYNRDNDTMFSPSAGESKMDTEFRYYYFSNKKDIEKDIKRAINSDSKFAIGGVSQDTSDTFADMMGEQKVPLENSFMNYRLKLKTSGF
jgi:hypothetical protein